MKSFLFKSFLLAMAIIVLILKIESLDERVNQLEEQVSRQEFEAKKI